MIDAKRVNEIFLECLFEEGEDHTNHVEARGIMTDVGFHPQKLESHRQEVTAILGELPDSFKKSGGGGMSFLNACVDKDGNQWGEHRNMEQLFLLGLGLGLVTECLPRQMWAMLPGNMPYYTVLL